MWQLKSVWDKSEYFTKTKHKTVYKARVIPGDYK